MAKDDLGVTCWNMQRLEQRRNGMPDVMNLDQADVVGLSDPAQRPDEVPRFDRPSRPGSEHEIRVRPC